MLRSKTTRGASAAAKHSAEKILKTPSRAASRTTEAIRSETEALEVRPTTRCVSATRLRTEPFEALETRLAFGVDFSTVECLALVAVANNFVRSIELGETRRRLWIVLVGIRVQFFREAPIGGLDIGLACTLGNPQDFVGVAHRIQTPVKSPVSRWNTDNPVYLMWGFAAKDATRRLTSVAARRFDHRPYDFQGLN